jgi:hypothetical protein
MQEKRSHLQLCARGQAQSLATRHVLSHDAPFFHHSLLHLWIKLAASTAAIAPIGVADLNLLSKNNTSQVLEHPQRRAALCCASMVGKQELVCPDGVEHILAGQLTAPVRTLGTLPLSESFCQA